MTTVESVAIMADVWQQQTNQDLHLRTVERIFFKFLQEGFSGDDLKCVLTWVKWKNTTCDYKRQINLRLILDHDGEIPFAKFACDLGEAKAWLRNRRPAMTPKDKVLSQLRPVAGETMTVTEIPTAGEILKRVLKI
jgi:hypothetical protein